MRESNMGRKHYSSEKWYVSMRRKQQEEAERGETGEGI